MRPLALAGLVLPFFAFLLYPAAPPAPSKTHTVTLNGHTFTLPTGFTVELAAAPPLVDRPIVADFDEQGRLYVADSSGSNENVNEQLRKKPHRILRLEASKGDGKFDRRTIFADRMMFPEGLMCLGGAVYVAGPPSIWKLTDSKGTGTSDAREEWFQGKTLTGCANDLHGPYAGPDGWIYWCKGAFARQTYSRPGKPAPATEGSGEACRRALFVTRASHIFRCRPDGSGLEPVMTGGMDNPVDVVFTPSGERIFTTTFFQHPAGGLRDGLVHAVYGGVYGKEHAVIHDPAHRWTGPAVMPVLTHLGAAAPCGLARYESDAFGKEYRDNLFAALFNMQKVTRHVLVPEGATYRTLDEDFLVSSNRDFHPTDIVEDADGSLLVIDTGGWYKLCCPTSQLHKPDVLGAVYRVRREGAPRPKDPRGLEIAWEKLGGPELAGLLDDPRPAVRKRASETLGRLGEVAVPALELVIGSGGTSLARRNAVWALTRITSAKARRAVRKALADTDESVRQVAAHSASLWRDPGSIPELVALLRSPSLHNRRVAAEALGRIGAESSNPQIVPALLEALKQPADRVLQHSLTYALIEIGDREATTRGLSSDNTRTRRAALVALDQMDGGNLEVSAVTVALKGSDPDLKEAAWWIAGRHPEWGADLAGFFRERLASPSLSPALGEELSKQLASFSHTPAISALLAERLGATDASPREKLLALEALASSTVKPVPAPWLEALLRSLSTENGDILRATLQAARRLPLTPGNAFNTRLLDLASEEKRPVEVRLLALAAVPGGVKDLKPASFAFLRGKLDREQPVQVRGLAAEVLVKAALSREQLLELTSSLKSTGPMELDRLLDAYAKGRDEAVGEKLLAALRDSPVRSSLRIDGLKARLEKYGPKVKAAAEKLYAELDADAVKQKAQLEKMLASMKPGDVRRGQAVFNSAKTACSSCHAIGYLGGKVGPDLTHIGRIRSERDLLESILFPSASFVRSYEPVSVTMANGKTHNGLVRQETPEEIHLVLNATEVVRLRRADIEEMQPGKVSIMPAGLDKVLTAEELADLVAFLKACK